MKTKMIGALQVNGETVATVTLEPEHAVAEWGVHQVGRRWFDYPDRPMKNIRVQIGDAAGIEVELVLEKTKSDNGRLMYATKIKQGRIYAWANLVKGQGRSWGLTCGYIQRKTKEIKIPGTWEQKRRNECCA